MLSPPAYSEVAPSPFPEWYEDAKGRTQFRAKRLLECAWTDRRALMEWLYSESGAGYPHADGTNMAYVRGVRPRSRGKSGGTASTISHTRCILEVRYDTAGPSWVNGVYIEEGYAPSTARIAPAGKDLYWSTGDKIDDKGELHGRSVLILEHFTRIAKAVEVPSLMFSAIGGCNSSSKSDGFGWYSWPKECVLYAAPEVTAHSDYTSGTRYEVTFRHPIFPPGWNHFWHAATASWEYLYTDSSASTIYVQYPYSW